MLDLRGCFSGTVAQEDSFKRFLSCPTASSSVVCSDPQPLVITADERRRFLASDSSTFTREYIIPTVGICLTDSELFEDCLEQNLLNFLGAEQTSGIQTLSFSLPTMAANLLPILGLIY